MVLAPFFNNDYSIWEFFIVHVELNLLRNVDANNPESSTTVKSSSLLSGFRGGSSYNHETETIFALPRMQLDFKSIHVQEPQEPSLQGAVNINLLHGIISLFSTSFIK